MSILQNSPFLSWENLVVPCKIHISFISHLFELQFGEFRGDLSPESTTIEFAAIGLL